MVWKRVLAEHDAFRDAARLPAHDRAATQDHP
jgi:hypothetical protein